MPPTLILKYYKNPPIVFLTYYFGEQQSVVSLSIMLKTQKTTDVLNYIKSIQNQKSLEGIKKNLHFKFNYEVHIKCIHP